MTFTRLTELAHGGGCGCKLSPAVLRELLADRSASMPFSQLLVGTESSDDAAVWQVDDRTCVIATTDFFMPVVDDPYDFGRIAATNALSDVYAMGGKPIMALAILGMPLGKLDTGTVQKILKGGEAVCAEAGIPVAGGHSIDSAEPIYGLAAIGLCAPSEVRRNTGARAGDALILTKGIGIGVYSAAFRKEALPADAYEEMIASTTLLNRIGYELAKDDDVHGMTDVTGFGLLGHALEMARGSRVRIAIEQARVPLLAHTEALAQRGFVTGASRRNWESYGEGVTLPGDLPPWRRDVLTDPQTSGGLLIACAPARADEILRRILDAGYPRAGIVGSVAAGDAGVDVV
ncbi:selenophosphate synthase [Luteibacter sp. UNCMF331Sha3.1]|uniref:selenide, water dikinase SelD n=1 Tax=Luteibacter sp. UNCMF331Sha3.1 TaxID=1502760 RepID=UPI0008ADE145|nr:selenide, water dikinase SelD [Luteibacter sp. UNCMF331Sha3.1]SEN13141.1 selenophosphate synthase [Luteibacter sp. UNCMF331Sha3.1]